MTDRPLLKPLPADRWDTSLERVLDDMQGRPLNVHGLLAHNPELLAAFWDLRMHAVRGEGLSNRQRELIVLRVAVHMRAWYEWASHVERGLAAGLTLEEIERIRRGTDQGSWKPDDAMVLRAVEDCIQHRGISRGTLRGLDEYFSAAQILDILALYGMYVFLGTVINSWDPELDEFVKTPPGTSRESWLGDS